MGDIDEPRIPDRRLSPDGILEHMRDLRVGDADWHSGQTWSLVNHAGDDHSAFLKEAHGAVFSENALNPIAFPSLRRFEAEVVRMTATIRSTRNWARRRQAASLQAKQAVSWRTVAVEHHVREGEDGIVRCWWASTDPLYIGYHDTEWGFPVTDDVRLFEKLCLEGFQAGLSWLTILRKRDNFRSAFAGFDFEQIARFGEPAIARLLNDVGIVRHRGKIEATINNAAKASDLIDEFGSLANYVWTYAPDRPGPPGEIPSITPESTAMSKDLKKRGWRFVGPTTVYAFMQAMGLVNDHLNGCAIRPQAERERQTMQRP